MIKLTDSIKCRTLEVDGQSVTLGSFLQENMIADDVDHITIGDAVNVINLDRGEVIRVGNVTVKRIS